MPKRTLLIILVLLFSYRMMWGQGLVTKKEAAPDLSKIQPVSITSLKLAEDCDYGFFLPDSDLIAFKVSKTISNGNYDLYKFIIYNKMGELVKELDRVFWWGGGPLLLKISQVSSLLLIDMEKGQAHQFPVLFVRPQNIYPKGRGYLSPGFKWKQ